MTQKEILINNKIIAEFMGWKFGKYKNLPDKAHMMLVGGEIGLSLSHMKYHSSWDSLMTVIQQIEKSGEFSVTIFKGCCDIHYSPSLDKYDFEPIEKGGGQPKILSAYQAVVEFIKWYNKNYQP